jgi:hypothetical protein
MRLGLLHPYHVTILLAFHWQLGSAHPKDLLVARNEHFFAFARMCVNCVQPKRTLKASCFGRLELVVASLEKVVLV